VRRARRLNAIRKWNGTDGRIEGGGGGHEKCGNGKMLVGYHGNSGMNAEIRIKVKGKRGHYRAGP